MFKKRLEEGLEQLKEYTLAAAAPGSRAVFVPWSEAKRAPYIELLRNNMYIADHVLVSIGQAFLQSEKKGLKYKKFFMQFAKEEVGHEEMAKADLKVLGVEDPMPQEWRPHPLMSAVIAHAEMMVRINPISYTGALYALESIGASLVKYHEEAGHWGYPDNAICWLKVHANVNVGHAEFMKKYAFEFAKSESDVTDILHAGFTMAKLYTSYLNEVIMGTQPYAVSEPKNKTKFSA